MYVIAAVSILISASALSAAQPRISLLSPSGGELYIEGQQQTVRVNMRLKEATVELSRDGGATYQTLGTINSKALELDKRTSLQWTVQLPGSNTCFIRVSSGAFSAVSGMFAIAPASTTSSGASAAVPAAGSIGTDAIADGSITTPKLADKAVTTAKLADNAVTGAKIADGSVSAAKIDSSPASANFILAADGNGGAAWQPITSVLTGAPPAGPAGGDLTGNYPNPQIATGAVTTAKLANGSITDAKVNDVAWGKITGAPSNVANAVENTGNTPSIQAGTAASMPAAGTAGRLYVATDTLALYRDTGTVWAVVTPALTGDVTSAAGSTATTIANNSITNAKVSDVAWGKITGVPIAGTTAATAGIVYADNSSIVVAADGKISAVGSGITLGGDVSGPANNNVIGASAVTTGKIADGSVTTAKLAANAVTDANVNDVSWGKITGAPSNVVNAVENTGNTPSIQAGTAAAMPAAGTAGRLYVATDSLALYRDTGTVWALVTPALTGDVTSTAGSTATTIANGSITNAKVNDVAWGKITGVPIAGTTAATAGIVYADNSSIIVAADGKISAVASGVTLGGDVSGPANNNVIGASAVTTGKIADANVTTAKLADASVTTAKLAANAVTDANVNDVAWGKLTSVPSNVANAVENTGNTPSIQAGTAASMPAAGTAGRLYVATDTLALYRDTGTVWAVVTPALTGDVTSTAGSTATTIANGSITNAKVNDVAWGKITGVPIAGITAATAGIVYADNSSIIVAADGKISAVASGVTLGGDVSGPANNNVIGASAVTTGKIADANVTTAKLADASVTTAKLAANAVTDANVNDVAWGKLTSVPSNVANAVENTGNTPSIQAGTAASMPAAGTAGRLYVTTDTLALYRDTGTVWAVVTPALTGDVTSTAGSTATTIANNSITNAKVNDVAWGKITGVPIAGTTAASAGIVYADNSSIVVAADGKISAVASGVTLGGDVSGPANNNVIGASAVTTGKIADANVTTAKLADASVTTAKLAANAVTDANVNDVAWGKLTSVPSNVANAIENTGNTPSIQAGTAASMPAAGTAGRLYVATDSLALYRDTGTVWALVTPALTGDVTSTAGSTATTIANGSITNAKVNDVAWGKITGVPIAGTTAATAGIVYADNSSIVVAADGKLSAVASGITLGGDVSGPANNNVIGASAVTTGKIADANVTTAKLADASVTTAKLAANAVTDANVNDVAWGKLTSVPSNVANAVENTGNTPSIQAGTAAAMPAAGTAGRLYVTTDSLALYRDTGTAWALVTPALTGDVTSTAGSTATTIANGSITNAKVNDVAWGKITGVPIAGTTAATAGIVYADNSSIVVAADGKISAVASGVTLGGDVSGPANNNVIGASAVTTGKIADANVTTAKLADASVTTAKLAANAVTDANVNDVAWGKLTSVPSNVANAVENTGNTPSIQAGTAASMPAAGTAGRLYVATDTLALYRDTGTVWALVTPALTGDVTSTAGSTATTIANGSITNAKVNDVAWGKITGVPIAGTSAATAGIVYADNSSIVVAADGKLSAVASGITLGGDVSGPANNNVIGASAVTTGKIADANVTTAKLADASVTTAKLAANAVTDANVNDVAWGKLTSVPSNVANAVENKGNTPSIQAGTAAAMPAAGTAGRLYVTTDTLALYRDTGAAWALVTPALTGDVTTVAGSTAAAVASSAGNDLVAAINNAATTTTINTNRLNPAVALQNQANTFTTGTQTINTGGDAIIGLVVKGNSATQSADLQQWQNSSASPLMRLTSSGLLGIGSAVPTYPLTVDLPTTTGNLARFYDTNGAQSTLSTDASGNARFGLTGKQIAGSGGGVYATLNGYYETQYNMITGSNVATKKYMRIGNLNNAVSIQRLADDGSTITSTPFSVLNDAPSNSMYINSSGNIGIGTASPASRLHMGVAPTASANFGLLSLGPGAWDGTAGQFAGSANGTAIAGNMASGYIGDTINMQVNGISVLRHSVQNAAGASTLIVGNGSISGGNFLQIASADGFSQGLEFVRSTVPEWELISGASPYSLILTDQSNNHVMTFAQGGNVGIGTTPAEALDINGRIHLAQTTAPGTTTDRLYNVGGNLFWNGTNINGSLSNAAMLNTANTFTTGTQTVQTGNDNTVGLVLKANSSTQSADLQQWQDSTGATQTSVSATGVINGSTQLTLQETGDQYGTVRLHLQNRLGVNGAMFEQAGSADLIDFVFKGLNNQRTIRYENRNTNIFAAAPEFQMGVAADPTLVVSDLISDFRKGSVGINQSNPAEALDLNGRLHLAQTTAPGTTTDRLYNVGGNLFWNGTNINGSLSNAAMLNAANTFTTGTQTVQTGADANVGVVVEGNSATQSGDLQQWKDSSGNVLGAVHSDGTMTVGGTDSFGTFTMRGNVPSGDAPALALFNAGGGGGASTSIDFYDYFPTTIGQPQVRMSAVDDGNFSAALLFSTKDPGAAANTLGERMRLTSSGSLGIGTQIPSSLLQVGNGGGTGKIIVYSQDNVFGQLQLDNPNSDGEASIGFNSGATALGTNPTSQNGDDHVWALGPGAGTLPGNNFSLVNKQHGPIFNVLSTGLVGIQQTNPVEALDINGRLHLAQTSAPATTADRLYNVGGNLFWNGANLSNTFANAALVNQANTFTTGTQTILTGGDGTVGLQVQANSASQSANLQQWLNSDGSLAAYIRSTGAATFIGAIDENTSQQGMHLGYGPTGDSPRLLFCNGNGLQNWQVDNDNGQFRWFTPGQTHMTLDMNSNLSIPGQIGIRQPNPSQALEIGGDSASIYLNSTTSNMLQYNTNGVAPPSFNTRSAGTKIVFWPQVDATDADYAMGIEGFSLWYSLPQANNTYTYKFYGGTSELMRIQGDGTVGIGTTSPSSLLQVGNGSSTGKFTVYSSDNGNGQIQIGNPTSNGEASIAFISGLSSFGDVATSTNGADHVFVVGSDIWNIGGNAWGVGNQAASNSLLTVKSNGYVGIGVNATIPGGPLVVSADTNDATVNNHSTPMVNVQGNGDVLLNTQGNLFFDNNYTFATGSYIGPYSNTSGSYDSNTMKFSTSGTERLRIDSSGTVSIGTQSAAANALLALKDGHLQVQQTTAPTISAGANAGTSASASLSNATDIAGNVSLTTGTGAWASGTQLTVTFNKSYAVAPIITLTPTNASAANGAMQIYVTPATTGFTINFGVPDTGTNTYTWCYHVIETQ